MNFLTAESIFMNDVREKEQPKKWKKEVEKLSGSVCRVICTIVYVLLVSYMLSTYAVAQWTWVFIKLVHCAQWKFFSLSLFLSSFSLEIFRIIKWQTVFFFSCYEQINPQAYVLFNLNDFRCLLKRMKIHVDFRQCRLHFCAGTIFFPTNNWTSS